MKYFVATKLTQGLSSSDFFYAKEGEIVHYTATKNQPYLIGTETHKGTTTVMVRDGFSIDELERKVYLAILKEKRIYNDAIIYDDIAAQATEEVLDLAYHASLYDENTVLHVMFANNCAFAYPINSVTMLSKNKASLYLEAIFNVLNMIRGSKQFPSVGADEKLRALLDEIADELNRVVPNEKGKKTP